ncbi:MAG: BolA family transcriptional regulator [Sulfuritalea sp.]|jgi:acid stress-induced BolA-like protein IbaG/YrbA|nr:BolA family transcriptional regulator [Sulfuritalea sp.]
MLDPKQIESWIAAGLPCEFVAVQGDGQHFEAVIVSSEFVGLNRVKRQQRINTVLKARFDSGELHALSMKTLTPEEWNANG